MSNDEQPLATRQQAAPASPVWTSGHPLADPAISSALKERADQIQSAFAAIEPTLRALAPRQFEDNFAAAARESLRERLGLSVPLELLTVSWAVPLDVRRLYAHCVLATFCRLIERHLDRDLACSFEGESAEALIQLVRPKSSPRALTVSDLRMYFPPIKTRHVSFVLWPAARRALFTR